MTDVLFGVRMSYPEDVGDYKEEPILTEHIPEDRANLEEGYPCPNCNGDLQGGGSVILYDGYWECDVCNFSRKENRK